MDLTLNDNNCENKLDLFKDPFGKSNVKTISFWIYKSDFDGEVSMSCDIMFKNGNTEGKQIIEAEDFATLVSAAETFINSLENGK